MPSKRDLAIILAMKKKKEMSGGGMSPATVSQQQPKPAKLVGQPEPQKDIAPVQPIKNYKLPSLKKMLKMKVPKY